MLARGEGRGPAQGPGASEGVHEMDQRTSPLSLDALRRAVENIDPSHAYRGVTYGLAEHNELEPAWWGFVPYGSWSNYPHTLPNPSVLQKLLHDALHGVRPGDPLFIDLSTFGGSNSPFFTQNDAVIGQIIDLANAARSTTIRYLVGQAGPFPEGPNYGDSFLSALFRAHSKFEHPSNVTVYYGNFSPRRLFREVGHNPFTATAENRLPAWLSGIIAAIDRLDVDLGKALANIGTQLLHCIEELMTPAIPSYSWNHSKILAVNGAQIVTGGANYWGDYASGAKSVWDMSMRIHGDAALEGHRFLNAVWAYLASRPPADQGSFCLVNTLDRQLERFCETGHVPGFDGPGAQVGTVRTLSVARAGMWPVSDPLVSAQIFDAVRDLLINVAAAYYDAHAGSDAMAKTVKLEGDLNDDSSGFRMILATLGITPAAWATRYVRNYAIANASSVIRFSQQKLVMDDLWVDSEAFQSAVSAMNEMLGMQWDGLVWPFDTLIALATAIRGMNQSGVAAPSVHVLTSFYGKNDGYADPVESDAFISRLAKVLSVLPDTPRDPENVVKTYLTYKPLKRNADSPGNHSKVVIVDDAVCYVGSDNAYPSYNLEHGFWIEDRAAIDRFLRNVWDDLWKKTPL
jgi:phosphatidylserine/phosphatidylglycerophosphate/cardiolipin synthase-like enzyme